MMSAAIPPGKQHLTVEGIQVAVVDRGGEDYISLTDMVRDNENGSSVIDNWLRNKNTLEFLSVWETIYNPTFNSIEFEGIKSEAGLNRFVISIKQWIAKTNAIGINAKARRYGGTFAHRDIAFEFASWISPKPSLRAPHGPRPQRGTHRVCRQIIQPGTAPRQKHLVPLICHAHRQGPAKSQQQHGAPAQATAITNTRRQQGKHTGVCQLVPGRWNQAHSHGLRAANVQTQRQPNCQQHRCHA